MMSARLKGAFGGSGRRFDATTSEHERLLRQFLVRQSTFAQHEDNFRVIHPVQEDAAEWVIPANSRPLKRFKRVVALLVLWDFVCIPYLMAFGHRMPDLLFHPAWKIFEYFLDGIYVASIVVCFCTGYIDPNARIEVRNPRAIKENYMYSKWFCFDIISVFPLELLAVAVPPDAPIETWTGGFLFSVSLFYLLKFTTRCFKASFFVRRYLYRYSSSISTEPPGAKQILKIFGFFLLCAHVFGCFWLALEEHFLVRDHHVESWQHEFKIDYHSDMFFSYTASLFSGMLVMIDQEFMGFLSSEQFIGVFVMLFAAYMRAYLFGNVELIMERIMARNVHLHEKLDEAASAMEEMGLNADIQFRVRQYFIYCHDMKHERGYKHMIDELSAPLKTEIRLLLHSSLIQRTWLFDAVASPILRDVVLQLVSETYLPGDYIVAYGDRGVSMYFVVNGASEVINSRGDRLTVLTSGAYFGEVALLRNGLRTASVRALTWTTVAKLNKPALNFIINTYPEYAKKLNEGFSNYLQDIDEADSSIQHAPEDKVSNKLFRVTGRQVANQKLRKATTSSSFVTRLASKAKTALTPKSKHVRVTPFPTEQPVKAPLPPKRAPFFRNNKVAPCPPLHSVVIDADNAEQRPVIATVERSSNVSGRGQGRSINPLLAVSEDISHDSIPVNGSQRLPRGASFKDMSILPLTDSAYVSTPPQRHVERDEPSTPVQHEPAPEDPTESSDSSTSDDDTLDDARDVTSVTQLPFPLLCQSSTVDTMAPIEEDDTISDQTSTPVQRNSRQLFIRGRSLDPDAQLNPTPQISCESLSDVFDHTYRFFDGEGQGSAAEVSIDELTPRIASAERAGQQARADLLFKLSEPTGTIGLNTVVKQAKRLYRQQSLQLHRVATPPKPIHRQVSMQMSMSPRTPYSRRLSLDLDCRVRDSLYPSSPGSSSSGSLFPRDPVTKNQQNGLDQPSMKESVYASAAARVVPGTASRRPSLSVPNRSVGVVLPPLHLSNSRTAQQLHVLKMLEAQQAHFHAMRSTMRSLQHRCSGLEEKFIRIVNLLPP